MVSKIVAEGGGVLANGRLVFAPDQIERMLDGARRNFSLYGQRPGHEVNMAGATVHTGTGGASPQIVDLHTGLYREATLADLYDAARLADTLEHVHFFSRPVVACDVGDARALDINTTFAALAGTSKHVMVSASSAAHVEDIARMCFLIAGSQKQFVEKPFLSLNINHVVPPLRFAADACEVLARAVELGIPVMVNTFGQMGASSPVTMAGCLAQTHAETLAGMVFAWALDPQARAIYGARPMVTDLRTGGMAGGSGEQALLTSGCSQMHKFYGLPGGAAAGIADSKMPDMQAGWEQMCSNVMAGLSGCNMIYEAAGMHASLLGFCHESLILGDDLIGQAQRCVRGIEVTEETLALDQMKQVCLGGPGHYLGTEQTLSRMEMDHVYPALGDRSSPKEWVELGKPNLVKKATARKEAILSEPSAARFDPMLDKAIRERFTIHLPG